MKIIDTSIRGLKVVQFELIHDDRGHFARTFCAKTFEQHGLSPTSAQGNLSFTARKGTIRGMHVQAPPATEAKLMRCTRGAIMDVVVDLRPESPTFLQSFAIELTADNYTALYIPERFANGYQALSDGAEASYQVSEFYTPGYELGLRFDDPRLQLPWPTQPTVVSDKDRNWPLLDDARIATIRGKLAMPVPVF